MSNTTFGLRAAHQQAKQQKRKKRFGFISLLLITALVAFLGYRFGVHQTTLIHQKMLTDIKEQQLELTAYQNKIEELSQKTEFAKAESKTWQERYAREIPTGPTRELYDILTKRIEEGLDPERLSFVIRHAQPTSKCLEKPLIKKVPIGLKGQKEINNMTFFDHKILINGHGTAATNRSGAKEFWFDTKDAITINITHEKGATKEVTGKLPFQTLFQTDDKAYHFNFRSGPKGYCFVSATICDYP